MLSILPLLSFFTFILDNHELHSQRLLQKLRNQNRCFTERSAQKWHLNSKTFTRPSNIIKHGEITSVDIAPGLHLAETDLPGPRISNLDLHCRHFSPTTQPPSPQATSKMSQDAHALRVEQFVSDWEAATLSLPPRTAADFYYFYTPDELKALEVEQRNQQIPLFRLPAELRNQIYELVVREQTREWYKWVTLDGWNTSQANRDYLTKAVDTRPELQGFPRHSNLLGVCRRMRLDCAGFLSDFIQFEACTSAETPEWSRSSLDELRHLRMRIRWYLGPRTVEVAKANVEEMVVPGRMIQGIMWFQNMPEFKVWIFG
ncbi:hypothetical protein LTR56_016625 [Elasticomyces elasticus]|nr:hypothetical protein LTR56_016625 [Elasticomyces elasticus]KAK3641521.1 hypothetical protein LTR22_016522 [Elasticomyces elasticus]KAK4921918.1 hypothetical protein LTR49_010691 [Elasticomyces elasticus]KAK5758131.1 hypothetical protein LTS12_011747 [Elasticomyces elasticus]